MELELDPGHPNPPKEEEDEPGTQGGGSQIRLGSVAVRQHGIVLLNTFVNPQPTTYEQTVREKFRAKLPTAGWFHVSKPQKQVVSTGFAYAMPYSHETLLHALERNLPIPVRIDIDMEQPNPTLTQAFHHTKHHHTPWPIYRHADLDSVAYALRHEGLPVTIISWPAQIRRHHN